MPTHLSTPPEQTFALGREFAATLRPGDIIALVGDLGAGKTQWVKGLADGLGSTAQVTSPTFTLIHEYSGGRLPLYHFDCYRLETPEELLAIGLDDYLNSESVAVLEWADKFPTLLPPPTKWLRFKITDHPTTREIIS